MGIRRRLSRSLEAWQTVSGQVAAAAGAHAATGVYLGVKLLAVPVNVVEAFARPDKWTPPWTFL